MLPRVTSLLALLVPVWLLVVPLRVNCTRRPGPTFHELGTKHGTDKVTTHSYQHLYQKYLADYRLDKLRMLEIGLGCDMNYGPGKSLKLWTEWFPYAEVNFLEYDRACALQWEHAVTAGGAVMFIGDQADRELLAAMRANLSGPPHNSGLDLIIDDGGHTMQQQLVSVEELWPLLEPGGLYVIEDLQTSYLAQYGGGPAGARGTALDFVKSLVDVLHCGTQAYSWDSSVHEALKDVCASPPLPGLQSFECFPEACVFVKAGDSRHRRRLSGTIQEPNS